MIRAAFLLTAEDMEALRQEDPGPGTLRVWKEVAERMGFSWWTVQLPDGKELPHFTAEIPMDRVGGIPEMFLFDGRKKHE